MKHARTLIMVILVSAVPFVWAGPAAAAEISVTRELTVTAEVPHHRDIVVDLSGQITRITSNTLQDVIPQVYSLSIAPENRRPLSPELYEQYRKLVPAGTAQYGKLYERRIPLIVLSRSNLFRTPS